MRNAPSASSGSAAWQGARARGGMDTKRVKMMRMRMRKGKRKKKIKSSAFVWVCRQENTTIIDSYRLWMRFANRFIYLFIFLLCRWRFVYAWWWFYAYEYVPLSRPLSLSFWLKRHTEYSNDKWRWTCIRYQQISSLRRHQHQPPHISHHIERLLFRCRCQSTPSKHSGVCVCAMYVLFAHDDRISNDMNIKITQKTKSLCAVLCTTKKCDVCVCTPFTHKTIGCDDDGD